MAAVISKFRPPHVISVLFCSIISVNSFAIWLSRRVEDEMSYWLGPVFVKLVRLLLNLAVSIHLFCCCYWRIKVCSHIGQKKIIHTIFSLWFITWLYLWLQQDTDASEIPAFLEAKNVEEEVSAAIYCNLVVYSLNSIMPLWPYLWVLVLWCKRHSFWPYLRSLFCSLKKILKYFYCQDILIISCFLTFTHEFWRGARERRGGGGGAMILTLISWDKQPGSLDLLLQNTSQIYVSGQKARMLTSSTMP